ncbi:lipid IV(A) 3-deoxy-D-manno-octulosonic acid transferase [Fluoribacter dumoffii]|nr:lipid IV(A) 3-deoxy-D-manno-octulosonic acid transferase [Fluoribacter dumoffii]MCW8386822.1 lipid IV(A) 3-deoxy-D-manno-octulosonic acid transferase [Fluoribacter dumoffii]MCW8417643.1 lipid IV(A) 3-deoxy-D-manno-octulosonic acid transferase [Fluoribacter dumoffii]MCW8454515.1 lipid IV(A) 3-deoxy-D-manno-octulosonic acid transferase [Fluoribacter dumoffii]MCW8461411.1 lipid IV(A) 3-deoxy-D-manno-octulosonic acid transferase [Fluoribacter dumoffii]MCW8484850.1 lipid IV(A) 3-deoxy-D-manno-oc
MRFLYSFLMYLLTPFIVVRLWWKGRSLPAYRERIAERFFLGKQKHKPVDVWVHAVSLGEVIAAIPLIDAMLEKNWTLLVTTMTPTGSERVQARFGNKVTHQYLPYDLPGILKRFFKQIQPRVGVIMETELWPNLIYQARAAHVPLLLANARISDDSLNGYKKIKFLIKPILNQFSAILAQGEEDAQRYITLGAQKEKVHVLGNMKFDLQTDTIDTKRFSDLKNHWGPERIVVIAASTHENEEAQILSHLKRLQQAIPRIILLIAPRHPERFQTVYQLCRQAGFKTGLRSDLNTLSPENEIVVLDSLGELLGFYQISDYAFVGGSLVPVGGHNVLEPIAMNVPVLSGNQVHNFKAICNALKEAHGILLVQQANEVIDGIIQLHTDPTFRQQMIKNAAAVFEKNKGAVIRHLQQIEAAI